MRAIDRRQFCAGALAFSPARAFACPPPFETERTQFVLEEPAAPVAEFVLHGAGGAVRPIARFSGKALLLNFWASWCASCRRELPALDDLAGRIGREPFAIASVAVDRDPARALALARGLGLRRLPIFIDPGAEAARASFRLYGLPMSLVIDRRGDLVGHVAGEADWASPPGLALLRYFARG